VALEKEYVDSVVSQATRTRYAQTTARVRPASRGPGGAGFFLFIRSLSRLERNVEPDPTRASEPAG
jgi:hypothetical protein